MSLDLDRCPLLFAYDSIAMNQLAYKLACVIANSPEGTLSCLTVVGSHDSGCSSITDAPINYDSHYTCKSQCESGVTLARRQLLEVSAIPSRTISAPSILLTAISRTTSLTRSSAVSDAAVSSEIPVASSIGIPSFAVSSTVPGVSYSGSFPSSSTLPPFDATQTTINNAAAIYPNFIITFAALFFMLMLFNRNH